MVYEFAGAEPGAWDRFETRRIGLRVVGALRRAGGLSARAGTPDWAMLMASLPDIERWTPEERNAAARVLRAKYAPEETGYLRLLQRHARLRRSLLRMGGPL
jgi:hypothetical protein